MFSDGAYFIHEVTDTLVSSAADAIPITVDKFNLKKRQLRKEKENMFLVIFTGAMDPLVTKKVDRETLHAVSLSLFSLIEMEMRKFIINCGMGLY